MHILSWKQTGLPAQARFPKGRVPNSVSFLEVLSTDSEPTAPEGLDGGWGLPTSDLQNPQTLSCSPNGIRCHGCHCYCWFSWLAGKNAVFVRKSQPCRSEECLKGDPVAQAMKCSEQPLNAVPGLLNKVIIQMI